MYIARVAEQGSIRYALRKSYFDADLHIYTYRQIFDLGHNPATFIHVFNDKVVYFDGSLEDAVAHELGRDPTVYLEELLWDYIPLGQRRAMQDFRKSSGTRLRPLSAEEQDEVEKYIHIFDRRRMYYIRYGAVDQSRIYRVSNKLYRPLLYKCRDEKEHYISNLEMSLSGRELKKYIYVVFDLQKYFTESFATFMPEALDSVKMEEAFVEEICRLNSDGSFWQDKINSFFLRNHLQHYLIRFFDYEFTTRSFAQDFIRDFYASHRKFRWPERNQSVSEEEMSEIFGATIKKLKKMSETELVRIFRKKAKEHHPDRGGDQEKFVTLLSAYEQLKKRF